MCKLSFYAPVCVRNVCMLLPNIYLSEILTLSHFLQRILLLLQYDPIVFAVVFIYTLKRQLYPLADRFLQTKLAPAELFCVGCRFTPGNIFNSHTKILIATFPFFLFAIFFFFLSFLLLLYLDMYTIAGRLSVGRWTCNHNSAANDRLQQRPVGISLSRTLSTAL